MQWPGTELLRSTEFTDVRQSTIGHLSTVSAYLELPEVARQHVFAEILRVLPESVTPISDLTLHLARRVAVSPAG
ncbi:MAG TPA: hypothetical protein VHC49_17695 [Mycobacteriales bacterium]|nr:hypothetical protein [Mycobacteriales bacterium]